MKSEVKLRVATVSDAAELLKIYAPYVTDTAITFEYDVRLRTLRGASRIRWRSIPTLWPS